MSSENTYRIEDWLSGMVDYPISDKTLNAILFNRGVPIGSPADAVSLRDRELCYADILIWMTTSSQTSSATIDSDGGWTHQESAKNVTDKNSLRTKALSIYKKYGDAMAAEDVKVSKVRIRNLYGK